MARWLIWYRIGIAVYKPGAEWLSVYERFGPSFFFDYIEAPFLEAKAKELIAIERARDPNVRKVYTISYAYPISPELTEFGYWGTYFLQHCGWWSHPAADTTYCGPLDHPKPRGWPAPFPQAFVEHKLPKRPEDVPWYESLKTEAELTYKEELGLAATAALALAALFGLVADLD